MKGPILAFSTVPTAEDAERIAQALVEREVAACVNVLPGVVSFYRWKGEEKRDNEFMLVMKSRAERFEALRTALLEMHPYDVPELVAIPIGGGHGPYLDWLDKGVAMFTPPTVPSPGRRRGPHRPRTRR